MNVHVSIKITRKHWLIFWTAWKLKRDIKELLDLIVSSERDLPMSLTFPITRSGKPYADVKVTEGTG